MAEERTDNQFIQWNCRRQHRSGTWTSCKTSPRCWWQGTPLPPWCNGLGLWFFLEDLLWPLIQRRPLQNSQRITFRGAGSPDLLLPHLREVPLEPNLRPLAVVGRVAVYAGRWIEDFQISDPSSTPSSHSCFGYVQTSLNIAKNVFLLKSPQLITTFTVCLAQSPETIPALMASSWFIFAGMCLFVCFYLWLGNQLRQFGAKETVKNKIFQCNGEALKVFRKYRCHPVCDLVHYTLNRKLCDRFTKLPVTI